MRAAFLTVSFFLISLPGRGEITGTVIGSDGRSLAGARVAAFALETAEEQRARWVAPDPVRKPLVTIATDGNGRFAIDPKVPVADLRIEIPGEPALGMRAAANEDAGVLQVATTQPLVRAVITANGKPLPGATVIVRSGGAESVATTDARGQYWLPDPKRVPSRILVQHAGYAPVEREVDAITLRSADVAMTSGVALSGQVVAPDGQTAVANAIIQIDDLTLATTATDGTFSIEHAPLGGRRIVARAGDRVAARLLRKERRFLLRLGPAATIAGSVRDLSGGTAIAGAQVTAAAPRFDGPDAGAWTITDDKGNYAITGLAGGEYELTAVHPGYATPRLVVNAPAGGTARKALYTSALARIAGSVVDDGARAIGGAAVSVRRAGGDMVWTPAWVRGPQRAVTAPNGRFLLRTAEEGSILLDAKKAGLPAAHSGIIRVAAGARTAGIVITIPRGVALTGRVITRDRKPVADAALAASDVGEGAARDAEEIVRTKADGTFSMHLRESVYNLVVTAPGHAPRTLRAQASAGAAPLEVTLEPGVEVSGRVTRGGTPVEAVDVFTISGADVPPVQTGPDGRFRIADLAPGEVMLAFKKPAEFIQATRAVTAPADDVDVNLPAGGRVAGRVLDKSTRNPVKSFDAGVSRGGAALMVTPAMRAFAADDGTFAIDGVPVGSHTLSVSAPGYVMARIPNVNVESGKSVDDVEAALERGVRVSGRVTGPNGAAGGVLVRVDPTTSTHGAAMNDPFTLTGEDGEYLLDSVDPGPTTLAFSRSGLLTVRKNVTLSGSSAEVDAQLGAGSSIAGVVVLDSGAPVANAEVHARSAVEATDTSALTDESGTFAIAGVAAGHYEITAARAGLGSATLRDVEIPAAGTLRIQMKRGGVIEGRLTGLTPAELHGTTVQAWSTGGGNASASADESGRYRVDGAPAGTVRVSASARTPAGSVRNAATKSVQLAPGTTANVDFEFVADIVVSGRITRNGTPLPGVAVSFVPASAAQRYARTVADGSGRYEITGIDNGSYTVTVLDVERGPYSTTIPINGSRTFDVDLKGARVAGRVSDASTGGAIAEALVELRRTDAGVPDLRTTLSDAGGGFSFDEVVAGSFEARVRKAGYGAVTVGVAVREAGAPALEVKLAPSSGVALRVVDGRDARALNGWYHAESGSGESFDGAVAGTAEPAPIALAAGTYRLTVGAAGYAPRTLTIVAPGEKTIALTPGGTIIVSSSRETFAFLRIIDAAGQPVRFGPGPAAGIRVDPAPGQTRIANVTPGTYVVQLLVDGNVLRSAPVTVREGETVPAQL